MKYCYLEKGITDFVYEQMTNQLSASSGPNNRRHFVKERATHVHYAQQGYAIGKTLKLTSLLNLQKLLSTLTHKCKVSKLIKRKS